MTVETETNAAASVDQFKERLAEIESKFWEASRVVSAQQDAFVKLVKTLEPTGDEGADEELSEIVGDKLYDFGLESYSGFDITDAESFEAWEPSTC